MYTSVLAVLEGVGVNANVPVEPVSVPSPVKFITVLVVKPPPEPVDAAVNLPC